ncbi:MAG: hypothetical protein IPH28_23595 [Cytophagaceae bacterium]|nr:hypothetical protein [Cytophagaceae bacterium]
MNSGMAVSISTGDAPDSQPCISVGNGNPNRIAVRWQGPLSERTAILPRPYAAIDASLQDGDINDKMWLLK